MSRSAEEYLKEYVAIPSINPMGRSDQPAEWVGEARLAAHIQEQLRALSVDVQLVGSDSRPSVVGFVQSGRPDADTVLVASHLDTVPWMGWRFRPLIRRWLRVGFPGVALVTRSPEWPP